MRTTIISNGHLLTDSIVLDLLDRGMGLFELPLLSYHRRGGCAEAVPAFCSPCEMRNVCLRGCKAAAQVCYGSLFAEELFLYLNCTEAKPLACR